MSAIVKKALPFALALALCFTFIGCAGEETLTQEEIDQIMANSINATYTAETYQFDMDMAMTANVTGGEQPAAVSMTTDGSGALNNTSQEMQMTMNGTMTMGVPGQATVTVNMSMDSYIVDNWIYTKVSIPGIMAEDWTKMELPADMWDMMWDTETKITQGQELMELAEISFLRSEAVDGIKCYVFDVALNMTKVADYILQLMPEIGEIGVEPDMLTNLLQKVSISTEEWIAKDSNLMMKTDAHVLVEITPEDLGATVEDFEKITMDMNINVTMHDYNEPTLIELPPEALSATEI